MQPLVCRVFLIRVIKIRVIKIEKARERVGILQHHGQRHKDTLGLKVSAPWKETVAATACTNCPTCYSGTTVYTCTLATMQYFTLATSNKIYVYNYFKS